MQKRHSWNLLGGPTHAWGFQLHALPRPNPSPTLPHLHALPGRKKKKTGTFWVGCTLYTDCSITTCVYYTYRKRRSSWMDSYAKIPILHSLFPEGPLLDPFPGRRGGRKMGGEVTLLLCLPLTLSRTALLFSGTRMKGSGGVHCWGIVSGAVPNFLFTPHCISFYSGLVEWWEGELRKDRSGGRAGGGDIGSWGIVGEVWD